MRIYIISLMISVLFFTGCKNENLSNNNDDNDQVIVDTDEADANEADANEADANEADANEADANETVDIGIRKSNNIEIIAKEWYMRIVVEDTTNNMKTASAQLGQLTTTDVVAKHTLKAIAPFRPTFLDVVFVNPLGVDAGSYTTNFHASGTDAESWEFTIKSHDTNATMILGWRGLYVVTPYIDGENRERYNEYRSMSNPLLNYMTLLDVTTNTEIDVLANGAVNEYVFNMNGLTERTFIWKVKDTSFVTSSRFRTFSKIVTPAQTQEDKLKELEIISLRKDAKARPDTLKRKRLESFDMLTPPTFEVLVK